MATNNKAVVAGAGPVGALAAIPLARQGWDVEVRDLNYRTRCCDGLSARQARTLALRATLVPRQLLRALPKCDASALMSSGV